MLRIDSRVKKIVKNIIVGFRKFMYKGVHIRIKESKIQSYQLQKNLAHISFRLAKKIFYLSLFVQPLKERCNMPRCCKDIRAWPTLIRR